MIIDSHTHAWASPDGSSAEPIGPLTQQDDFDLSGDRDYLADSLLVDMDAVGVDEAVVVELPANDWTDNSYTVQAVDNHDRLSGIVMVDQFADGAARTLHELLAVDGVLGFRLAAICPYDQMWEAIDHDATWLRDAVDETAFWDAALETDAIVQIMANDSQLNQALELVESYPELTYLFDHFAHTNPDVPPEESDFVDFADFADYDTVGVKVSSAPHVASDAFPYRSLHDHVHWLLKEFGREQIVWGSDFPNVSDAATYDQTLAWLDYVEGLTAADRQWLTSQSFRALVE